MSEDRYQKLINSRYNQNIMELISMDVHDTQSYIMFNVREQIDIEKDDIVKLHMQELYSYIRQGDTKKVIQVLDEKNSTIAQTIQHTSLEQCRLFTYAQVYLIAYMAIEQGAPDLKMRTIMYSYHKYIEEAATTHHLACIAINFFILFTENIKRYCVDRKLSSDIKEVANYIEKHLHEKIIITKIAEHIHLSARQLTRKFNAQMGCSIKEYINEEKVKEARYLLRITDLKLAEIASYLSFSSESYFIRIFKQFTGQSPYQFRNANAIRE